MDRIKYVLLVMTKGIDLSTIYTEKCNLLCKLDFGFGVDEIWKVINDGTEVNIEYEGTTVFGFKNMRYHLQQILLYYPPYHKLDNLSYDAELTFVSQNKETKNILMLSVFLEVNEEINTTGDPFFKEVSIHLPHRKSTEKRNINMSKEFSLRSLFPEAKSFYNYKSHQKNTDQQHIIFGNVMPIYYEYYVNIKKKLKYRQRNYFSNKDIILYFNKNIQDTATYNKSTDIEPDAKLHFVKCRKVRKTIKESEEKEEFLIVELDLPRDIVSGFKVIVWIVSYLSTILLTILIIKLIHRSCWVEKFTDALQDLWGKTIDVGSRGMDAIKRRRGKM